MKIEKIAIIVLFIIILISTMYAEDFNTYFKKIEEINLNSKGELIGNIYSQGSYLINFSKKGQILCSDVSGKQSLIFNKKGVLERVFTKKGNGPYEAQQPLFFGASNGSIYLVDAVLRRITRYDENYNFQHSFFITTKHTQPPKIVENNGFIYCPAYELNVNNHEEDNYIIKYTKNGKYLKSFYKVNIRFRNKIFPTWNKSDFIIFDNLIYAIQATDYKISVLDTAGNLIKIIGEKPDYFILPSKEIPEYSEVKNISQSKFKKIIKKYENSFSNALNIFNKNNLIFLFIKLNGNNNQYMMEIYNTEGKHIAGNIKTEMPFINIDSENNLYFMKEQRFTEENTYYTIEKYSYIGKNK